MEMLPQPTNPITAFVLGSVISVLAYIGMLALMGLPTLIYVVIRSLLEKRIQNKVTL